MRSYYAESVRKFATRQRFQRWDQNIFLPPRVVASSNPGLELVNAFGVQIRVGASSKLGLELVNAFGVQIRTPFGA